MKGTFLFLGTGSSTGVPSIGCKCAVCTSHSPKNKRLRPSGFVEIAGKSLLIDAGPDLRAQLLHNGIDHLDGLLLTHTHYDHIAGIDELRVFSRRHKKAFPCLLSRESFEEMQRRYHYLFNEGGNSAKLEFVVLEKEAGKSEFLTVPILYCSFKQGAMKVTGFRFGELAYISDIHKYEESLFSSLQGVRKLILSSLQPEKSPVHLSFEQAVLFAKRTGAEETWLTHLGHAIDHDQGNGLLPPEVRLAYDGLKLEFTCTN